MPPPDDPWSRPGAGPGAEAAHGRHGWAFALGLVTAVVLTGVVATVVVLAWRAPPTPTTAAAPSVSATPRARPAPAPASPSPSAASPTPAPVPTPTPAPATTAPTAAPQDPLPSASQAPSTSPGPDRSLRTNTLYRVDLDAASSSCGLKVRRPKPPLADKKLQPYLNDVAACLTSVFKAPLAAHGFTLVEPKVRTYHRTVDSPCGDFDQHGSPAYYCSTTETIYWPDTVDDGREAYTFARLGYVGLTAHEFGHHVQKAAGMLDAYSAAYHKASKKEQYALSRRLELQAQCFEGVFLHVARRELHVTSKDRDELRSWHSYTGDEDPPKSRKPDHGSSKAQYAWLAKGLGSGDFGSCNTWTASAKSVT